MISVELAERSSSLPPFAEINLEAIPNISELRLRAWKRAAKLEVPTTKDEEWKYTDLRHLASLPKSEGEKVLRSDAEKLWFAELDQIRITFVDGIYDVLLSDPVTETIGIEVMPISQAFENNSEAVSRYLASLASLEERTFPVTAHLGKLNKEAVGAMGALNTATFSDGAYVRVQENATFAKPIHIVHISTTKSYCAPRAVIVLEKFAEATIIESYFGSNQGPGFTNAVTEVFVAENAKCEHVKVQEEQSNRTHVALTEVRQEADSTYLHYNIGFGAKLSRNDINVFLNGSNLHCRLDGVIAISASQHHDNHTRLDHAFPHCDSFEVYKHVLADSSTAVFNGKIFVHEDAQKTDAKQTNQTLLLSPTATIDTKPQLEIFADDVKCTHGATIGRVRDDAMFYARTRGIPESEARALLVYAFAAEVIEKISNVSLRKILEQKLFDKLR